MSGDYSKDGFDALRSFAGVFLQQGRAVLDSDWNEMVRIIERRIRSGTVDTMGRAVVPRETPQAFEIRATASGLAFGRGRFYVDGLLCESFGTADFAGRGDGRPLPVLDRARPGAEGPEGVLDEMIAPENGDVTDYAAQPYWPTPTPLPGQGRHLVYLVAWQREVTPTEMPELLEPALDGLDTTTRWQTVWQVRLHEDVGADTTCDMPDADVAGWAGLIAPSGARLTTGTVDVEDPEDPCLVPPTDGYTGIENQFYRVEIHAPLEAEDGGAPDQGSWGFKFSRENASVRAAVTAVAADGGSVTVSRMGRDEVLRFQPGDWVEITDDHREFNHRSGQMLRVAEIDPELREVMFEGTVASDLIPAGTGGDTLGARHSRLIRWDQRGVVRLEDGTEWADLDAEAATGLIPVPPDSRAVLLESGITVSFATAEGPGRYHEMDHWCFAARTAGTRIEILNNAPPDGIQRHYARLALAQTGSTNAATEVDDCRVFWPPTCEGGGCACTVCVTPESHNSGSLTLQAAIDQLGPTGGSVCLEQGFYSLGEPVRIADRGGIRLIGQGMGTVLIFQGPGGAIEIESSTDVSLERFTILGLPQQDANGVPVPLHGIAATNTLLLAMRRLAVVIAAEEVKNRFDFAIALDELQIGTRIEQCLAIGPHAIGARSSLQARAQDAPPYAAFAELSVTDCLLFGGHEAVRFDGMNINLGTAHLERNLVMSQFDGLRITWAETPLAALSLSGLTVSASQHGMVLSARTLRVQDCEISGGGTRGDGIRLVANNLVEIPGDGQIIGNTLFRLGGAGIRIAGDQDTLFIKRNIIRDCAESAIAGSPDTTVRHLAIDNNAIERIGLVSERDFAMGIGLGSIETGQIIGNSIRTVGRPGFPLQLSAAIALQGFGSLDISSNVISEIGSTEPRSQAVGILVIPPYVGVNVSSNRIFGPILMDDAPVAWSAIRIGPMEESAAKIGTETLGFLGAMPGTDAANIGWFAVDEQIWSAAAGRLRAAMPRAPRQIALRGNQVRGAMRLQQPMLFVLDPMAQAIGFSDNQCDQRSRIAGNVVVALAGPRLNVSGNTVTQLAKADSIRLRTGPDGAAIVIGNITSTGLTLNNAGLPAPFDALNLHH